MTNEKIYTVSVDNTVSGGDGHGIEPAAASDRTGGTDREDAI